MTVFDDESEMSECPITSALDNTILMHRDAHFSGDFMAMLAYYEKGGKGICQEIDIKRIRELMAVEEQTKQNLAPLLLSAQEAEKVREARDLYKKLRDLYDHSKKQSKDSLLIADLILSEEEEAEKEIEAIIAEKGTIVPILIDLLHSENLYDPLFPGYGLAPALAAKCLGKIGDKRAIIALFESMNKDDFFHEDLVLKALEEIGEPAKEFLLKVVRSRPITIDNEHAAIALAHFNEDPKVSLVCFTLLKELDLQKDFYFGTYLVLACGGLVEAADRKEFMVFGENPKMPKILRQEIQSVAGIWNL